jgi:hypothetical protein
MTASKVVGGGLSRTSVSVAVFTSSFAAVALSVAVPTFAVVVVSFLISSDFLC